MSIKTPCSRKYRAVHNSGTRPLSAIHYVVIHDEEASSAESAAKWFANPASEGSAHLCVDDIICYRTLNDEQVPWAAANRNFDGFHIELAGFASWAKMVWKVKHLKTLKRAAFKTAQACHRFKIPTDWVTASDMVAGKKGITTHREISAFTKMKGLSGDSSHTDPGIHFPKFLFMHYVRVYRAEM